MIKLKRLKINRYRNVEPCDLVFGDRFNILLGPNGAGKTTLLNLISRVLRTSLSDTSDPFSLEIELSFPGGSVSGNFETFDDLKNHHAELSPELSTLRATTGQRAGHAARVPLFELQARYDEPQSIVKITRTTEAITINRNGDVQDGATLVAILEFMNPLLAAINLATPLVLASEIDAISHLKNAARFDESLDMFRSITARQDDASEINAGIRPQLRRVALTGQVEHVVFIYEGLAPPSLRSMVKTNFAFGTTDVSMNHDQLRFLSETCRLLGLRSATAKLELIGKSGSTESGTDFVDFGNLKFWFTRKDGSIFQDQHLSYGQKRLLTFLYYLECNPSIVIADELVNGLHHAWIKECMEAIGERQAFLTSQNPLLLDYLFFTSVQEVKESFILCRTEAVGNSEKMIWRNLTDDEAAMFYSAYKVGIEHVGEILRTRGLW